MPSTPTTNTEHPARPGRRVVLALALVVLCLVAAACGSRRTDEELIAAIRDLGTGPDSGEFTVGPSDVTVDSDDGGSSGSTGGGSATTADGTGTGGQEDAGTQPGGDQGGGTPVAQGGSGGQSCTGNEKPLKIGMVGLQSGIVGSLFITSVRGMQAWVAHVNAQGGLNCHPVEYIVADDGGDPSRHQSLVRELVEEEGVVAFVNMAAALSGQSSLGYLESNQIPVIGTLGGSPWALTSPMYFPQMISGPQSFEAAIAAAADAAVPQGKTNFGALYCVEAPLCSSVGPKLGEYASKYGMNLVYDQQVTIVAPDYTSQCQAAKRAGAEVLFVAVDPNAVKRVARSCSSVNFHPQYATISLLAPPTIADDPNLDGLVANVGVIAPMISGHAALDEYRQAIAQYAPGIDAKRDPGAITGWTSGELLEAAATKLGDTPTSADLLEGLWSIKNDDLGGLTTPLTFTRGQPTVPPFCYWTFQFSDGTSVVGPTGSERKCP